MRIPNLRLHWSRLSRLQQFLRIFEIITAFCVLICYLQYTTKTAEPVTSNTPQPQPQTVTLASPAVPTTTTQASTHRSTTTQPTGTQLLVNTSKCKIISTEIWPQHWQKNWKEFSLPNCSALGHFAIQTDDDILILDKPNSTCELVQIIRNDRDDNGAKLLEPVRLIQNFNVSTIEMFSIRCGHDNDTVNFGATVPPPSTRIPKKVQYWKEKEPKWRTSDVPISVLLLGLESTSRSHMFRSFPETLAMLQALNFVDFRAHHSVSPYTIRNFFAFLGGSTLGSIGSGCMRGWATRHYDSCPWLWHEFSRRNYATLYMEDGPQSFNHPGDKTTFKKPPTDYYIHPLLVEMRKLSVRLHNQTEKSPGDCASSLENGFQFMLNYLRKFVKKVSSEAPFFAFTFLAYPFHDYQLSHQNYDGDLVTLLNFLNSSELLKRTLVMVVGDHGDRHEFFSFASGLEGYMERSLPPLFVRLPEALKNVYPAWQSSLESNSQALTSHFDIHTTLLHTLAARGSLASLDGSRTNRTGSSPRVKLRLPRTKGRSLFRSHWYSRGCDDIPMEPEMCACNAGLMGTAGNDLALTHSLKVFAIAELNKVVQSSPYGASCVIWTPSFELLRSTKMWKENRGPNSSVYILQFGTNERGRFQVRIHRSGNDSVMTLRTLGGFSRINSYGSSSSCLNITSPQDKIFRELCLCKDLVDEYIRQHRDE